MGKRLITTLLALLAIVAQTFAQSAVSGKVTDKAGEPLVGVNVLVKGTTTGTMTELDGSWNLPNVKSGAVLVFSSIGYAAQEVTVGSQKVINVVLADDSNFLDEVVVVGYGTARKKDVSGAIASVNYGSNKDIANLPNPNAFVALSSKVAGLHYLPTNSASGSNLSTMTLRGRNTIPSSTKADAESTNAPMIIVDGAIFYGSIQEIQTNDIQSIDVMKDASSAAIYGSRAANGVIVITTKSGRSDKPTVNFNADLKFNTWGRRPRMQTDDDTFIEHRFLAMVAANKIAATEEVTPGAVFSQRELEVYKAGTKVDWFDEISQTAPSQSYSLSISGRKNATSYYISGGYDRTRGVLKGDNFRKFNVMSKVDTKVADWLTVGLTGRYMGSKSWGCTPSMQAATWMSPYSYTHSEIKGYENWINSNPTGEDKINPLWGRENASYLWTDNQTVGYNIGGVGYAQIDFPFLPGLQYKLTLNAQRNTSQQDLFNNPQLYLDTRVEDDLANPYKYVGSAKGYVRDYHTSNWNIDNILTYTTDIKQHHIDALAGYTREAYNQEAIRIDFSEFDIPAAADLGTYGLDLSNANNMTAARQRTSWQRISYLARLNYNFANRYYLTGNYRRDGYSAFAEGNKWGDFFGASAAWTLSNENFMKDVSWLDFLKLRLSWGQNGSSAVAAYSTIAGVGKTYTWLGEQSVYAMYITGLENKSLTWATTSKWNLGFDFAVLGSRLDGTVDVYTSATTDQLLNRSVPYVSGFPSVDANAGKVTNRGVEITLHSINLNGDGVNTLNWETNLTFDLNRNKIVKLFDDNNNIDVAGVTKNGYDLSYALMPGHSITSAWDYKLLGIFQSKEEIDNYKSSDGTVIMPDAEPGDLKFADIDDDGKITTADKDWIGDMDPLFTVNLGNTFSWKNFSLYFSFRWMQGNDKHFLGYDPHGFSIGTTDNQLDINPWTESNHSDKYPRYGYENKYGYNYWNKRSFLKLKDLTLSYNFNSKLLRKASIQNLRLYVSATDLFTITGWSGLDPENGGTVAADMSSTRFGSTPTYRTVSFGANITF